MSIPKVYFFLAAVLLVSSPLQAQRATLEHHTVEVDGHPMAVWEKSPADPSGRRCTSGQRTTAGASLDIGHFLDLTVGGLTVGMIYALIALGYDADGDIVADGTFTYETTQAVRA